MKSKNKKHDSIKAIGVLSVFFIPIFVIIYFNGKNRKEKLETNSFHSIALVEKLKPNSIKGTTTRKDIVYFYFVKDV